MAKRKSLQDRLKSQKTFQVDNQWLQRGPSLYLTKVKDPLQLTLPGMTRRLPPFVEWASYGLYALLDPDKPTAPVRTTPTELLDVLGFARDFSSSLSGYETFSSDSYRMVEEALHLLYSVELERWDYWNVRKPGQKRRRRQLVRLVGRFLTSYKLIYPEGVTPADFLPDEEREDINITKGLLPDSRPIWRAKDGPRPEGIEYQIDPELVRGLSKEDPHIGITRMPFKIFELRKTFGRNPTATRVLVWVMRQAANTMTRDLDGLVRELNLDTDHMSYMRGQIIKAFEMLEREGVIVSYEIMAVDSSGRGEVAFVKSKDWYLDEPEDNLPEEPEGTEDEA